MTIDIDETRKHKIEWANGDPRYGVWFPTPKIEGRIWPKWSLRYHLDMRRWPNLTYRYDNGGPPTQQASDELLDHMHRTHKNVGNHVYVLTIEQEGMFIHASVISLLMGKGHVSTWLDTLSRDENHAFAEVVDDKMACMLHRRGFELMTMSDDEVPDEMWLPVHVRLAR